MQFRPLAKIDRVGHPGLCSGLNSKEAIVNADLTPELEQLVDGRVKSGRYNSASEVVGEALRLLEQRDEVFALRKDEIRNQIEEGWHAARRGEFVDGEEVIDRIDKELELRERSGRN